MKITHFYVVLLKRNPNQLPNFYPYTEKKLMDFSNPKLDKPNEAILFLISLKFTQKFWLYYLLPPFLLKKRKYFKETVYTNTK